MTGHTRALLCALLVAAPGARADSVACHLTYGGQTQVITAQPTASPYPLAPVAIGSRLLFRIVFRQAPADLASIKLYTYVDRDEGPAIIHQATYAYPPLPAASHGFTSQQVVYEPVRDGELQYWCELKGQP